MKLAITQFFSVFFTSLALAPSLGHLLELPNKIGLSGADYFTVQQIYRGWALLGIVVFGSLLATLALSVMLRKHNRRKFALALSAFLCIAATQVVFWLVTFPANQQTGNWTVMPANWMTLRMQWEYSYAASAVLNLVALVALMLCILAQNKRHQ